MFSNEFLQDQVFLKELDSQRIREHYLKIELLDFKENPISEIQGRATSGTINIDGDSSVRRTCNLSLVVDESNYDLTNPDNIISINKKVRISCGYRNFNNSYKHYGEILWFPLGVFIILSSSMSHNTSSTTVNITGKDKMCLLNGECGGKLPAPVSLHEKYIRNPDDSVAIEAVTMYDIIRESVIHLGGEDPSKVIINDVPLKTKKVMRYVGTEPKYFDQFGNEVKANDPTAFRVIKNGDLAGYDWVDFTYPGELIKQAGESVVAILDTIKNTLGNYEYFYDVDGNFIFQEIKNYLNTSYRPITELGEDDYSVNFGESHLAYSFKDTDIVASYNNTPNFLNIKNDFIVWGKRTSASGAQIPIRYHLSIDDTPSVPDVPPYIYEDNGVTRNVPWQVYLYKYGKEAEKLGTDPGYYYRELQNELPKLYNLEKNEWKDLNRGDLDYYLDFIDSRSELGKYSVNTIGRRTEVINDDKVTTLYRPDTPDYIILEQGSDGLAETIKELNGKGQKFIIVEKRSLYSYAGIGKDAFGVVRDLVFKHTTYNESISFTCLPIYHLQPNTRVEVEDRDSNIYGEYLIRSISLPLAPEGLMSINAVRATNRL